MIHSRNWIAHDFLREVRETSWDLGHEFVPEMFVLYNLVVDAGRCGRPGTRE